MYSRKIQLLFLLSSLLLSSLFLLNINACSSSKSQPEQSLSDGAASDASEQPDGAVIDASEQSFDQQYKNDGWFCDTYYNDDEPVTEKPIEKKQADQRSHDKRPDQHSRDKKPDQRSHDKMPDQQQQKDEDWYCDTYESPTEKPMRKEQASHDKRPDQQQQQYDGWFCEVMGDPAPQDEVVIEKKGQPEQASENKEVHSKEQPAEKQSSDKKPPLPRK